MWSRIVRSFGSLFRFEKMFRVRSPDKMVQKWFYPWKCSAAAFMCSLYTHIYMTLFTAKFDIHQELKLFRLHKLTQSAGKSYWNEWIRFSSVWLVWLYCALCTMHSVEFSGCSCCVRNCKWINTYDTRFIFGNLTVSSLKCKYSSERITYQQNDSISKTISVSENKMFFFSFYSLCYHLIGWCLSWSFSKK